MAGSSAPRRATESGASARQRSAVPATARRAWSPFSGRALELVAVLALTLLFFGGFLALLGVAFPAGESLRALALEGRRPARTASFAEPVEGGTAIDAESEGVTIAMLDVLRPDVKRRASQTIAWDPAHDGQALHDRDAVQTGDDGRALVRFTAKNELHLERNSLVVVTAPRAAHSRRHETEPDGSESDGAAPPPATRRGLTLMEGELLARLQAPEQTQLDLSLPNVTARLADTTSRTPARFRVSVRKDHSATVAVFDGRLHLESRSGIVSIGPRQFSRVSADGDVSPPRALPDAPADCVPAAGAAFTHLDLPPRVAFSWSRVPGADQYRVRAARDPDFRDVVLDETVSGDSLTWGRARPGPHWWQVSGVVDDIEGMPTRARALVVRRETAALRLSVAPLPQVVHDSRLVLRGEVDARAKIYVMGRAAEVGRNGAFQIELELQPGANVVVVEAVDAAGHTAYWSRIVHVKP